MDQSMNMEHNYEVPSIPGHSYQRNNSGVMHRGFLRSLIHMQPQELVGVVEGRGITRWLQESPTKHRLCVYHRLEKQVFADLLPCHFRQPQYKGVKTFVINKQRKIRLFLQTNIKRSFKKLQEDQNVLGNALKRGCSHVLNPLPPSIQKFQRA